MENEETEIIVKYGKTAYVLVGSDAYTEEETQRIAELVGTELLAIYAAKVEDYLASKEREGE